MLRSFSFFAVAALTLVTRAAHGQEAADKLPVRFVDRPLTLPQRVLAPEFGFALTHFEFDLLGGRIALNGVGLNLGVSYGIVDDFTVDITPFTLLVDTASGGTASQTTVYYGTFRLGGTYRFAKSAYAEIGGRLEFGATGANDTIHLSWGLPVVFRAPRILRIDTGVMFTALLPVGHNTGLIQPQNDIALAAIGPTVPLVPQVSPGIPFDLTVQIVDQFFAGFDTGFGIVSFRGPVDQSCFAPLGFHAGGTAVVGRSLLDIVGSFSFPLFLLGAEKPPFTNIWQVGLNVKAHIPL
jgi:hypothetical protein